VNNTTKHEGSIYFSRIWRLIDIAIISNYSGQPHYLLTRCQTHTFRSNQDIQICTMCDTIWTRSGSSNKNIVFSGYGNARVVTILYDSQVQLAWSRPSLRARRTRATLSGVQLYPIRPIRHIFPAMAPRPPDTSTRYLKCGDNYGL